VGRRKRWCNVQYMVCLLEINGRDGRGFEEDGSVFGQHEEERDALA